MKKHGWVKHYLDGTGDHVFISEMDDCVLLELAEVFSTRKGARMDIVENGNEDTDVVRKVKLDKNGRPVKVIPGR